MWTLPRFIVLVSLCSTYYQNLPWGSCQGEVVPGKASKGPGVSRSLRSISSLDPYFSLETFRESEAQSRDRRHSDLNQVLTITVENRLVEGLKEAIDQYLNEMRKQGPTDTPTGPHYDYHYDYDDESVSNAAWDLFNPMVGSGAARINTPLQCLVRRCSLGLFSISGQAALSTRVEVIVIIMVVSLYQAGGI